MPDQPENTNEVKEYAYVDALLDKHRNDVIIEQEKILQDLENNTVSIADRINNAREKNLNKYDLYEERKDNENKILHHKNILISIKNGGTLVSFTDKKNTSHENIPDFTKILTEQIIFNEDSILTDIPPIYIPVINEEVFAQKGYIFDAIRIGKDYYLLAVNGYRDHKPSVKYGFSARIAAADYDQGYVILTLDQLALVSDYYYTKAKAKEAKKAEDRNRINEEYWDSLPDDKKEKFLNQPNQKYVYDSLPAVVKKRVTFDQWVSLTWQEKAEYHKFYKKVQGKRLTSKLGEDSMWVSFHHMYERFINPEAKEPKPRFANKEVWEYWVVFRERMKWKIKDIRVQRQFESDIRAMGIETSFGESNTDDILKKDYGILVKRQNGDKISPLEIDQIKRAWIRINNLFGGLKKNATDDNLKISHTGIRYVFASKAIGMYVPKMKTIAVSEKFGDEQFENNFAHETAHYIDNVLGLQFGRRYYTDDYENTAGKLSSIFRNDMNRATDSDYINATKECFARALQQYYAITTYGEDATMIFTDKPLDEKRTYFTEDHYVNKEIYYGKIKPLIEQFIAEHKDFFRYGVETIPDSNIIESGITETITAEPKLQTMEKKYDSIKDCLLSDGDNENNYILEGTEVINTEGNHKEAWKIISFMKDGILLSHDPASILSHHKGQKTISFEEFSKLFEAGTISIATIEPGDTKTLNLCIKSIKKCMDFIDMKAYANKMEMQLVDLQDELIAIKAYQQKIGFEYVYRTLLISPGKDEAHLELIHYPDNKKLKYRIYINGAPQKKYEDKAEAQNDYDKLIESYLKKGYMTEEELSKRFIVITSIGDIDLRWDKDSDKHRDKFKDMTKKDHLKLAAAHAEKSKESDSAELKGYHSGMSHWHKEIATEIKKEMTVDTVMEFLKMIG